MSRKEDELVINALATYMCIQARKKQIPIWQVDIKEFADKLGARYEQKERALKMARNLQSEFF